MKNVTVIVLVGGESRRFWPLSNKILFPLAGKTYLERQIEKLKKNGFPNILVVTTPFIKERFIDKQIEVIVQEGKGQGRAILSAKASIGAKPILVVNGDDLVEDELFTSIKPFIESEQNFLVGIKPAGYFPGGYLEFDGSEIIGIKEKPGEGNEPSTCLKLVCDYYHDCSKLLSYLERTQETDFDSHYESALNLMMKDGERFSLVQYRGVWLPLKYPWHVLAIMDYVLQKEFTSAYSHPSVFIHKTAEISGAVVIDANVKIMEYAKIVGPTYIGAGSVIGNHTMVRSSMIGEHAVIGFGSDVTRSFIGNETWLHTNYVGDSVLSDNVGVGAGAVLANLRLDEKEIESSVNGIRINTNRIKAGAFVGEGSRIGIQAQVMPGIKIGRFSLIGPGVLLNEDLGDNKRCYIKQEHTVTDYYPVNIPDRDRFRKLL